MVAPSASADSEFEASAVERALRPGQGPRARRWLRRALLGAALCGVLAVVMLLHALAGAAHIRAEWAPDAHGQPRLVASPLPALRDHVGSSLHALHGGDGSMLVVDASLRQPLPRWIVEDSARALHRERRAALAALLAQPGLELEFSDGRRVSLAPAARGVAALGASTWALVALALLLQAAAVAVLLARPQLRNLLYAVMALSQSAQLLFIAAHQLPGLGPPLAFTGSAGWPYAFDLATAAAAVHAFALHPRRLRESSHIAFAAWSLAGSVLALLALNALPAQWWWVQGATIALGLAAAGVLSHSYRVEAHPFALVLRRFTLLTVATLALATLALVTLQGQQAGPPGPAADGTLVWSVFFALLLLLVPFLARARLVLRELAVLAALGITAAALGLLYGAVLGLTDPTAMSLIVLLTLAVYITARPWLLSHMVGGAPIDTEILFEQLYRAARAMQAQPAQGPEQLAGLLRALFEPRDVQSLAQSVSRSRVVSDGAALLVPIAAGGEGQRAGPQALLLGHARQGQRIFTREDARLADRVVEQLRRAVAYEQAVERGRREERLRIAQDLHDDIGARLLTLMYQAQTPAMEDYLRHTLQDLKTLTRGLAATESRLSHAAAEWKHDAAQRLGAARITLEWRLDCDEDIALGAVQWSGLTRVLRELLSNTIAHARATRVDIGCSVQRGALALSVADDGEGGDPADWHHGLGLGGVRKRVKLLGGEVAWARNTPQGIVCTVTIADLRARR